MILLLLEDQIENDAEAEGVTLSLLEENIQHTKTLN
jgi:hypothetical protein